MVAETPVDLFKGQSLWIFVASVGSQESGAQSRVVAGQCHRAPQRPPGDQNALAAPKCCTNWEHICEQLNFNWIWLLNYLWVCFPFLKTLSESFRTLLSHGALRCGTACWARLGAVTQLHSLQRWLHGLAHGNRCRGWSASVFPYNSSLTRSFCISILLKMLNTAILIKFQYYTIILWIWMACELVRFGVCFCDCEHWVQTNHNPHIAARNSAFRTAVIRQSNKSWSDHDMIRLWYSSPEQRHNYSITMYHRYHDQKWPPCYHPHRHSLVSLLCVCCPQSTVHFFRLCKFSYWVSLSFILCFGDLGCMLMGRTCLCSWELGVARNCTICGSAFCIFLPCRISNWRTLLRLLEPFQKLQQEKSKVEKSISLQPRWSSDEDSWSTCTFNFVSGSSADKTFRKIF